MKSYWRCWSLMSARNPYFTPSASMPWTLSHTGRQRRRACRPMPACTVLDPTRAGSGRGCSPPGPSLCSIPPPMREPTICRGCRLQGWGSIACRIPGLRGWRLGSRGGGIGSPSSRSCCSRIIPSREPASSRRSRRWDYPATGCRTARVACRCWKRGTWDCWSAISVWRSRMPSVS